MNNDALVGLGATGLVIFGIGVFALMVSTETESVLWERISCAICFAGLLHVVPWIFALWSRALLV